MILENKFVYVGHDKRIIKIVDSRSNYSPIVYEEMHAVFTPYIPDEVVNDMHNYSIQFNDNDAPEYVKRLKATDYILEMIEKQKKIIRVLEKYENFMWYYLRAYNSSVVMQHTYAYIMAEIEDYKLSGNVGSLLNAIKTAEPEYTIDDIVEKETMKHEDIKNMFSYMYLVESNVKSLIKQGKYDEALFLVKKERGKTKW